jgi:hypothetical protein
MSTTQRACVRCKRVVTHGRGGHPFGHRCPHDQRCFPLWDGKTIFATADKSKPTCHECALAQEQHPTTTAAT